jgi:hypothetical protein
MNTLAVLMVPIYGKRLKFFRRHIAPPSSLVSLLLPPRFAAEAITCAGVCQYIHRIEGASMIEALLAPCAHAGLKGYSREGRAEVSASQSFTW